MGRVKDYLIWHEEKYGFRPIAMDRVDEFLEDERVEHDEYSRRQFEKKKSELVLYSPSIRLIDEIRNKASSKNMQDAIVKGC